MTFGITGEPTFYLNDLAGTAGVDVSGVKSIQEMDEKPITTYLPAGTITSLKASDAQKWFQFKGGQLDGDVYNDVYDGDLMYGVKSVTNTEFPNIPDKAETNTTLRFHQYNLQDDYLGTLSEKVFGSSEAANLFANVPELKKAYNVALQDATKSSNALMNDMSGTVIDDVDVSKKLAKTIMSKYPERFELKFQAKFGVDSANVPNGYLGYDTSLPPGKQITKDWFVYNNTAVQKERTFRFSKVKVTLSDQNEIDDIVLTKQGDGYKMGDKLYLIKDVSGVTSVSGEEVTLVTTTTVSGEEVTAVPVEDQFIVFDSILDVQANTLNHSLNLEDILYSAELAAIDDDDVRRDQNASITNLLFLPGVTVDATLDQRDVSDSIQSGEGATVSVVCGDGSGGEVTSGNDGAVFKTMTVTKRGYDYKAGKILTVHKNNAKITHTIDISDARMLNLGVLTVEKATITSLPVYNNGASGEVVSTHDASGEVLHTDADSTDGSGAIVVVTTKDKNGTDVSFIEVDSSGSGYLLNDLVQITNPDNKFQTIDVSLTQFDANLLNGLTILDLSQGEPTIDTRSFRTHDDGFPSKILGITDRGNVVELDVSNNGTWVKSITVRDGSTNGIDWDISDTIIIRNIDASNEIIELSGDILDVSFINALNNGEEYILTHDVSGTDSLTDSSNALTAALTGGVYFEDASTNDLICTDPSGAITDCSGAIIEVTTTEKTIGDIINGIEPIVELNVTESGAGYIAGDTILIRNDYQRITKVLTVEDAKLLNGIKELGGVNYPGTGAGNDNNNRKITSIPIFTDGAFGEATGLDGSGAIIRVNTSDASDSIISILTVRTGGNGYIGTGDVTITNVEDARQTIALTIDASGTVDNSMVDIEELNDSANKILSIKASDVQPLFYGGSSTDVQAVRNGVNNKHSEAVVTIICDGNQSEDGADRGANIQAISLQSAARPGTDNTDELYYEEGDSVTFTVDQSGNHLNEDNAINQDGEHINVSYTVKYVITIKALTEEQADVLNGNMVGTNVPLLPGDVLVLKSTISSPSGIEGQEQFDQSFLTQYQLAE